MTLQDLRTFVAVVEAGTMGEVARSIRQSQPAIAQHVRRLEREFGTVLLDRTPRGVELTDAGRALYERTSAALAAFDDRYEGPKASVTPTVTTYQPTSVAKNGRRNRDSRSRRDRLRSSAAKTA